MKENINFLKNKSILVTGGTGSFGQLFVETILKNHNLIKKLVVFSRDELKQFEMAQKFPEKKYKKIRYFLGDLRDKERIYRALDNIDIVIHTAALKQVPKAEYDPFEYIKTNIIGAQNLIEACLDSNVENLIALSTDKAVSPINLYGATKLCADKLFISARNIAGNKKIKFSVVRYGNVTASRGSIIPFFKTLKDSSFLPITHKDMTRFNISLKDAVSLVMYAIKNNFGGEIFVPKLPSFKVTDLALAMFPKKKLKFIGIREGEKIHEELISKAESLKILENDKFYIVLSKKENKIIKHYRKLNFKDVKKIFSYSSGTNPVFLNQKELKKII